MWLSSADFIIIIAICQSSISCNSSLSKQLVPPLEYFSYLYILPSNVPFLVSRVIIKDFGSYFLPYPCSYWKRYCKYSGHPLFRTPAGPAKKFEITENPKILAFYKALGKRNTVFTSVLTFVSLKGNRREKMCWYFYST